MATDYTLYENQYRYMENILRQIRLGCGYQSQNRVATASEVSFSDVWRQQNTTSSGISAGSMDAIFEEAAAAYNVPVNLLKAIGKTESNFDPNAQSQAGAQGVMQLMPETARSLGVTDPFDARSNIMGGAKYISDMLKRYNGDIDLALAAYNAGSGNVAKYGGVPPFKETQNYIKKVKEYMGMSLDTGRTVQTASAMPAISDRCFICGLNHGTDALSQLLQLQIQSKMISLEDYLV